jgi:hypothetical protein
MKSVLLAVLISTMTVARSAQSTRPDGIPAQLAAGAWPTREDAFDQMMSNPGAIRAPRIQDALVSLLERENQVLAGKDPAAQGDQGEGYAEYLARLGAVVLRIAKGSDNLRAVVALVHSGYNPDSELALWLATRKEALPALMTMAQTQPAAGDSQQAANVEVERGNAVYVLSLMLKRHDDETQRGTPRSRASLSEAQYSEAKALVLRAATSGPSVTTRQLAVKGIALAGKQSDMPLLQRIAANDPASDGKGVFPVRAEALRALQAIQGRMKQTQER